ncbi:lysophospholipid acyltransferase family protein [Muricoccus vinaceus]|uniref:Lysophospholipid acyltransferase family protein n=1 Tax=Muricoccus vinaceus TaxID=424704 RepID=A0ABV6IN97_9PROT
MRARRKGPLARGMKALGKTHALWHLIGWYLGFCRRTARWELHGAEPLRALAEGREGFVMAFWHECLPLMPLAWAHLWESLDPGVPRKAGLVLVSRSRDGALIANALGGYGLTAVEGSSTRGGRGAGIGLLRGVRSGSVAVVVPDGPRGPRRQVSGGAVRLAMMAGVPVVPCGAYAVPSRRLASWDRMVFPLPFSRCVAVVGAPILPSGESEAAVSAVLSLALDTTMNQAEARARGGPGCDAAPGGARPGIP